MKIQYHLYFLETKEIEKPILSFHSKQVCIYKYSERPNTLCLIFNHYPDTCVGGNISLPGSMLRGLPDFSRHFWAKSNTSISRPKTNKRPIISPTFKLITWLKKGRTWRSKQRYTHRKIFRSSGNFGFVGYLSHFGKSWSDRDVRF